MRGGVTREEAWTLSYQERKIIWDVIEKNIKDLQDAGMLSSI